jgi:hypothetical protein
MEILWERLGGLGAMSRRLARRLRIRDRLDGEMPRSWGKGGVPPAIGKPLLPIDRLGSRTHSESIAEARFRELTGWIGYPFIQFCALHAPYAPILRQHVS